MKIYLVLLVLLFAPVESGRANERPPLPVEKPAGSGVIVHRDGYVLTAHHVVANAKRITIVTSGEFRAPAVLVSVDAEHDLKPESQRRPPRPLHRPRRENLQGS